MLIAPTSAQNGGQDNDDHPHGEHAGAGDDALTGGPHEYPRHHAHERRRHECARPMNHSKARSFSFGSGFTAANEASTRPSTTPSANPTTSPRRIPESSTSD